MAVAIAQLAGRPDSARLSEAPRNWAGDAQLPATVRLVPGGALASRPRWDPDRVLTEVVRAVPKFHSLPWYDYLAFQVDQVDRGVEEHYGQARAFIRLLMQDGRRCELVFVRWLLEQNVEISDILASECGAILLMWAPLVSPQLSPASVWHHGVEFSRASRVCCARLQAPFR